jgi:iron complex transport system substrate-binding protein
MFAPLFAALFAASSPVKSALYAPPSFESVFLGDARVKGTPKRIVTVAPSVTETIFGLGAGERVIGVSRYDDFPLSVKSLAKVGGFLDPNLEAIVALAPDLVVGVPNAGNRPILERIAKLGTPVLIVPGNALSDLVHAARAIAPVLGGDAGDKAEKMIAEVERDLTVLADRSRAAKKPPRVAFVYGASPLVLAGPGSFAHSILELANAKNVAIDGGAYPQYSLEKLVELGPEVIIDASELHESKASAPWAKMAAIPAVKNQRVYSVPLGDVLRPGPRIAEGFKIIVDLLYR